MASKKPRQGRSESRTTVLMNIGTFRVEMASAGRGLSREVWLYWQPPDDDTEHARSPTRDRFPVQVWPAGHVRAPLRAMVEKATTHLRLARTGSQEALEARAWDAVVNGLWMHRGQERWNERGLAPMVTKRHAAWDADLRGGPSKLAAVQMEIGSKLRKGLLEVLSDPSPRSVPPTQAATIFAEMLRIEGVPKEQVRTAARPLLVSRLVGVWASREALTAEWDKAFARVPEAECAPGLLDAFFDSVSADPSDAVIAAADRLRAGGMSEWKSGVYLHANSLLVLLLTADWDKACVNLQADGLVESVWPARAVADAVADFARCGGRARKLQQATVGPNFRTFYRDHGFLFRPEVYGVLILSDPDPPLDRRGLAVRLERLARRIALEGNPRAVPGADAHDPIEQRRAIVFWLYNVVDWRQGLTIDLRPVLGDTLWAALVAPLDADELDAELVARGKTGDEVDGGPGGLGALMRRRDRNRYLGFDHPATCTDEVPVASHYIDCLDLSLVTALWQTGFKLSQRLFPTDLDRAAREIAYRPGASYSGSDLS